MTGEPDWQCATNPLGREAMQEAMKSIDMKEFI